MTAEFWLHPTTLAHWQAMVESAQKVCGLSLAEEIQHYLVITLDRYTNQPLLTTDALALDYLQGLHLPTSHSRQMLRTVGDRCLLTCGFFPGQAEKRTLPLSYYIKLGKSAYQHVAKQHENQRHNPQLFYGLRDHFVGLLDLLHTMKTLK